jgi:hypothetical protein
MRKQRAMVIAEEMNVRSTPDTVTLANKIGKLKQYDVIELLPEFQNGFVKVNYKGRIGWVAKTHLRLI